MPDDETRDDFFPPRLRERIESIGTVTWNESVENYTETELEERIRNIDVLVTGWGSPQVTEEVLSTADELGLIVHTGGSVANYVSASVYKANIPVVSANDVMADHTAEHTIAALLAKQRAIPELATSMKRGTWEYRGPDIRTLHGATVGLIGLGSIGQRMLDHLAPFDPTVKIYDPYVNEVAIDDIPFATLTDMGDALSSDIVSIHAARTPETVGMISTEQLAQIPDNGVLVNTARAEIVDEDALLSELRSARLSAVLDVYHEEPLPPESPLRDLENVLLTPHVGGSQIRPPLTEAVLDDVERFRDGEMLEYEIPRGQWETMTR
ncbi:hydroxyacid dehydrogenase [Saliphagus sp. LR7]|uniref:hydroxyacid dehydrogenase n=1 Tax=Saliphagus sp. LR7 TaxID=2282654 RepID=UPI001E3B0842|nr:hydroxyacid dehydrogenase [Saliphagus sp. LR7]